MIRCVFGCCLIPCCIDSMKVFTHYCPRSETTAKKTIRNLPKFPPNNFIFRCRTVLGKYKGAASLA